ncbi:MAG: 2-oxoacid:acceptor oxidoreductase subunit alpha [Candidatus Schekmanbacteria bacterium]|nr:2-oxoacid:acceptor oxidoreductase subunit alpha [Candidatus Schekmanbacteria bacterium]
MAILNQINILMGGEAGQGIIISSLTLAKTFSRGGLYTFVLNEYPKTIRGLHNWCSIRVNANPLTSHTHQIDLVIALNKDTVSLHQEELKTARGLIYDPKDLNPAELLKGYDQLKTYAVPLNRMIKSLKAESQMRNSITIGAALSLVKYDFGILADLLREMFQRKGDAIVQSNIDLAHTGYQHIQEHYPEDFGITIEKQTNAPPLMLLSGNEAAAMGAIRAGVKLLAAYPMTPTSSIIHYLAARQEKYNLVVKHTEDEIAAVNMAIGGNFAGVRSFACTSGGGFALMTEALGLAAQSETPLVLFVGQRPGPSTGQPTHTSQGDLRCLIHASQGEFPRIVIVPGDHADCFYETWQAFNLAERFQVPVLVLSDKYLGESYCCSPRFDTAKMKIDRGKLLPEAETEKLQDYRRYQITADGISPRTIPGQKGGRHIATSYEHDEKGFYADSFCGVTKMADKRAKKLAAIEASLPQPKEFGAKQADITIIAWGSTKGVILEALDLLAAEGIKVNYHQIVYIWPFPAKYVQAVLRSAPQIVTVENNQTAQLAGLIREHTGFEVKHRCLKYDGQPFYPREIHSFIKGITGHD